MTDEETKELFERLKKLEEKINSLKPIYVFPPNQFVYPFPYYYPPFYQPVIICQGGTTAGTTGVTFTT